MPATKSRPRPSSISTTIGSPGPQPGNSAQDYHFLEFPVSDEYWTSLISGHWVEKDFREIDETLETDELVVCRSLCRLNMERYCEFPHKTEGLAQKILLISNALSVLFQNDRDFREPDKDGIVGVPGRRYGYLLKDVAFVSGLPARFVAKYIEAALKLLSYETNPCLWFESLDSTVSEIYHDFQRNHKTNPTRTEINPLLLCLTSNRILELAELPDDNRLEKFSLKPLSAKEHLIFRLPFFTFLCDDLDPEIDWAKLHIERKNMLWQ